MAKRGRESVDLRSRSIEVMQATLGSLLMVTRRLWVGAGPKNRLLKLLMAPLLVAFLAIAVILTVFVFLALLLLVSLVRLLSRHRRRSSAGTIIEGKAEKRD